MRLSKTVQDALNDQIKHEMYSSYLYLAMSAYSDSINLPGFAHWLRIQSQEENVHAMKIFDFIIDRGGRVELKAIDQPPVEFGSPLDIVEQTLEHERFISDHINQLYDLAIKENDHPTQVLLQWFITEQVEEEKSADQILQQLKLGGAQGTVLFMIDRELAQRVLEAQAE
jgi:ferritin